MSQIIRTVMEILNYISIIISILGIPFTLYKLIKLERAKKLEAIRDLFRAAVKSQVNEANEFYYSQYFKYYDDLKDFTIIDAEYYKDILFRHSSFKQLITPSLYHFPLFTYHKWLYSKNPNLTVSIGLNINKESNSINEPDSFLTKLNISDYFEYLLSQNLNLWNEMTYDLNSIHRENDQLQLGFTLGNYRNYVNHGELLRTKGKFQFNYRNKKITRQFHTILNDQRNKIDMRKVLCPENSCMPYASCVGVNVMTIMKTGEGYQTMIQKRGSNVVEAPNMFHVSPAGTFQPLSDFDATFIEEQFSFEYIILREFIEEIFSMDAAQKNTVPNPFDIFHEKLKGTDFAPGPVLLDDHDISLLKQRKFTQNKRLEIKITAFSIDMLTLKPEVSAVIYIKEEAVYENIKNYIRSNWEGNIKLYYLESKEFQAFLQQYLNVNYFLPVGGLTLLEGLNYFYREIKGEQEWEM